MYLVFNVFYFYSGVGQKDSGVGRAHLAPPVLRPWLMTLSLAVSLLISMVKTLTFGLRNGYLNSRIH
jgi:hypothetical protein